MNVPRPDSTDIISARSDTSALRAMTTEYGVSQAWFDLVTRALSVGYMECASDGRLLYLDARVRQIVGLGDDDPIPAHATDLIHPDDRPAAFTSLAQTVMVGLPFHQQARVPRPDGEERIVMVDAHPLTSGGQIRGHIATVHDITDRLANERQSSRLSAIVEASSDLVAITDGEGRVLFMNAAARAFYGLSVTDPLEPFDFAPFMPRWASLRYATETVPALRRDGIWSGELAYLQGGTEVGMSALFLAHHDDHGRLEYVSSVTRDITERKAFESRLEYQASHDPLTSLPNRVLFLDRLAQALARGVRTGALLAVLFLDVDRFKVVNDSLGHRAGDRLLVELAERLGALLRPGDTVARFGGDEFVVLLDGLKTEGEAVIVAERIQAAVREPIDLDGTATVTGFSIGIAFSRPDSGAEPLIRDADAAMYLAKARGRGRFEVFDEHLRATLQDRLDTEQALRRALPRHELRVYYQPAVDLTTGEVIGVEALLRWEHPERGLLAPADFLDVAVETGLIVPIGLWVFEQACEQAGHWQADMPAGRPWYVSVNLSGRQLESPALVETIAQVLHRTKVDPGSMCVEIAEEVVMRDPETISVVLVALKKLGLRVAVDDFGTGYSSLAYLRRFPLDVLEIDAGFIGGLGRDAEDSAIVAAVISLAHSLGMKALAEGVEDAVQLAELRNLGCDLAQGYLVAHPMPAAGIGALLAGNLAF